MYHAGYCAFVDAEHALDKTLAESIGVNTENLLLSQPDCGEQALSLVDTLIRSGSVDVIVVDSVSKPAVSIHFFLKLFFLWVLCVSKHYQQLLFPEIFAVARICFFGNLY